MKHFIVAVLAGTALWLAPAAVADTTGFTSPSGNISCMIVDELLRCDIAERDWSPPPRPADCSEMTSYGQGISLRPHGPAEFVCAGDTTFGYGDVLPYGQFHAEGGMSCNSEPWGMRCSNSDGHGFTISRQEYALF
ncbi:MAG: hypothetical protein KDB44_07115 [Mycobacterium sp.]|nr:hypothetical protein [Mycobacterium sp.]